MRVLLLRVGKGRTRWADQAVADYLKRLPRQLQVDEKVLRPAPFQGDVGRVRNDEGGRLLAQLKDGDRLVALDERGNCVSTEAFTAWFDDAAKMSTRRLVFAIGGPYGHDPRVRDKAWRVLALSPMVVNHELARVVLVEQLYRASTLLWGGAYHH